MFNLKSKVNPVKPEVPVFYVTVSPETPGYFIYYSIDKPTVLLGKIKENSVGYWNVRMVLNDKNPTIIGSTVINIVSCGTYFEIKEKIGGWYKYSDRNSRIGWISEIAVEECSFMLSP